MPDRYPSIPGESLHSVAMNYGTLPRAPRRPPPSPTMSLRRSRAGSGTLNPPPPPQSMGPQGLYATLSRQPPPRSHSRQASFSGKVNGTAHLHQPHQFQQHSRASGEGPPQPRRLDIPPDSDWRQDVRHLPPPPPPRQHQPLLRQTDPRVHRTPQLCSLCRHMPAEPMRQYCAACGAYMTRFRHSS